MQEVYCLIACQPSGDHGGELDIAVAYYVNGCGNLETLSSTLDQKKTCIYELPKAALATRSPSAISPSRTSSILPYVAKPPMRSTMNQNKTSNHDMPENASAAGCGPVCRQGGARPHGANVRSGSASKPPSTRLHGAAPSLQIGCIR